MGQKKKLQSADLYYMDSMCAAGEKREEYLEVVHNYIRYYYARAGHYKTWYLCLSVIKVVVLAIIPVSQTLPQVIALPWLVAGASSLCILLESLMELFGMKDRWILYRRVGNDLMREERQYVTKTGGYAGRDDEENFRIFVPNIENIIGNEASDWSRMVQADKTEGKTEKQGKEECGK
ncbi:MAG: DUF4231 domain-containing protein [Roseburia sp.]|nr:DUF4231 domain-containing protein [Roseburia sp.]